MNVDSTSLNRADTSPHSIATAKSTHSHANHPNSVMHNSNNNHIINSDENHSKSGASNKYYNHYYSTTHNKHNHRAHSHVHPLTHHTHSHSTPLTHTKSHNQHNQRHHRSTNKHHNSHNGHSSNSSAYHQPSFTYKSHHNNHKSVHHHHHSQSALHHHHRHGHNTNNNNNTEASYANHKLMRRQPPQETLSDSEMMDLNHNNKHHVKELKNGNRKHTESTKVTTGDNKDADNNVTLSALQIKDVNNETESIDSDTTSEHTDDALIDDFKPDFPVKVIAFDLDKTMVRTISLHTNEQPQPEQRPNSYFMFFDEDTKEYHHVYKRPYLKKLLEFLSSEIVMKNRCKMMLCTHGTQKYAQTILEKCKADHLFPLMLPRKDWCRRKFDDDYKPRRFKTLEKMAKSVNERTEDLIMIDDDPGVYSKGDRCNGSLLHIKPFDDPYEQRNDNELNKLISFLAGVLKYGKNYYNKIFANSIRYTGLVRSYMNTQQMAKHSLLRAQLMKRLLFDFNILMDKQERLGTLFLFDRYCAAHAIDWCRLEKNKTHIAYYVLVLFGCLFIVRQYLYTDSKRPKQFRRDPYSAEIWLIHVEIYIKIVKKYKTMNGVSIYDPESKHHKHHHHHHPHKHRHHIAHNNVSAQHNNNNKAAQHTISMNDHQLITSYTSSNAAPLPPSANHHNHAQQQHQQHMLSMSYHSHSHHRRKRKHKHREKQIYFTELHNITNQICGAIGYPKLLHGLYHRPKEGYDSSLFVKYDQYVESLFHHIEKTRNIASNNKNSSFVKFD